MAWVCVVNGACHGLVFHSSCWSGGVDDLNRLRVRSFVAAIVGHFPNARQRVGVRAIAGSFNLFEHHIDVLAVVCGRQDDGLRDVVTLHRRVGRQGLGEQRRRDVLDLDGLRQSRCVAALIRGGECASHRVGLSTVASDRVHLQLNGDASTVVCGRSLFQWVGIAAFRSVICRDGQVRSGGVHHGEHLGVAIGVPAVVGHGPGARDCPLVGAFARFFEFFERHFDFLAVVRRRQDGGIGNVVAFHGGVSRQCLDKLRSRGVDNGDRLRRSRAVSAFVCGCERPGHGESLGAVASNRVCFEFNGDVTAVVGCRGVVKRVLVAALGSVICRDGQFRSCGVLNCDGLL